ncbi:S26 family signal peptidase [Embleya sp. NBC_00896]|uniref:S26 family signal peptidase n=1 Tax=Embleya sp. NBC_00896 TaxID=2975961 RepID=UPI002F913E55|nr:S26 family signal peptidase [Embleya sp. NBC_00896]
MSTLRPAAAIALGVTATFLVGVGLVRSRVALVRVTGSSMAPTFVDGERLLVRRTRRVRRGDAVVFRNPTQFDGGDPDLSWMVKRVAAMPGDPVPAEVRDRVGAGSGTRVPPNSLVLRGDAARTQDSRHFGYVPTSTLLGVVVGRLGTADPDPGLDPGSDPSPDPVPGLAPGFGPAGRLSASPTTP